MAEKKTTTKKAASAKSSAKATAAPKSAKKVTSGAPIATASGSVLKLGALKPAEGSWPKRQRIGRGHGSGMVKTGGNYAAALGPTLAAIAGEKAAIIKRGVPVVCAEQVPAAMEVIEREARRMHAPMQAAGVANRERNA